ncbi:MAG: putative RDD family membrane protein YckC [Gammaproteobacteria bacterium]|jgi:uncharacterized RDD family membrane protein YckC
MTITTSRPDSMELREAGFGLRIAAILIDASIVLIVFAILNVVLYKIGALGTIEDSQHSPLFVVWRYEESWLVGFAVLCASVVVTWTTISGSPGDLLLGLNVVRSRDDARAGLVRCTWRLMVSISLLGFGFLGAWRGKRALHDRLSGTRLVREDESTFSVAYYRARGW